MGKQECTSLETSNEQVAAIKTLVNDIRSTLKGNYPVTKTGLAIGSNKDDVANGAFDFTIDGVRYSKGAITTGTAPGDDVVPQDLYGAVAFDIGVNGTVDAIEAADNATGYATAALAIAGVPDAATSHARMGTVTAISTVGTFTFGTTLLDAANTTVVYTDGQTAFEAIGDAVT